MFIIFLEDAELLLASTAIGLRLVSNNVETNGLGQRSALANGNNISFVNSLESRGQVSGDVSVTLFKSVVLGQIVEVVTTNNNSSLHLVGDDNTTENTTTDGDVASERALLVNVVTSDGSGRGLEAQTDILEVSQSLLGELLLLKSLGESRDGSLSQKGLFGLNGG